VTDCFGRELPYALGIEEELFLVDGSTFEAVPEFSRVVGEPTDELKPELFECLVEIATPVVPDADAGLAELCRLRAELLARAEPLGVTLFSAGSHALARGADQPLVPLERYRKLARLLGDGLPRQLVCGLHVHVSLPDWETCLRGFEGVLPWLPTLLALSANSPFADGEATGRRSERAFRLLDLPTGGTPPVLRSAADWKTATAGDRGRRHWDAWPRPGYGTLEVRVLDMQTDVRRSAGFAELVGALVAAVAESEHATYDRELYARRRERATRETPDREEVVALAALVDVGPLGAAVLADRPEAERQLELPLASVPADVVARTLAF
jgi:carboxylate-amine ligase